MRITRLEAKGIGPFEDLNIEFKPKPAGMENKAEIHILTGENGTGKSTILMMLASCWDNSNDDSLIKRLLTEMSSSFEVYISNELKDLLPADVKLGNKNKAIIEKISPFNKIDDVAVFNKNISRLIDGIYSRYNISYCFFGYSGFRTTVGSGLVNIEDITVDPLENSSHLEKIVDSNLILKWVANVTAKSLISKDKAKKQNYISAIQKIEKALSDITGKVIEFDLDETLTVSIKVNGVSLSFNTLPDGLKSIISWLSDLLMRLDRIHWAYSPLDALHQNFILFLDEIEVHLHPSWQRKILPVVQDLFPNAQIFISTHSPFVVGSVDGARVYKFKLDENNNSVLDSEYWTEDGNSYQYYLREVFDIKNEFGVKIDESLQELQRLKEKALKGSVEDYEKFMILSDKLLNENPNSVELSSIVGFERRKLEKQFPTQPVTV